MWNSGDIVIATKAINFLSWGARFGGLKAYTIKTGKPGIVGEVVYYDKWYRQLAVRWFDFDMPRLFYYPGRRSGPIPKTTVDGEPFMTFVPAIFDSPSGVKKCDRRCEECEHRFLCYTNRSSRLRN
jgi:hypothetical protein